MIIPLVLLFIAFVFTYQALAWGVTVYFYYYWFLMPVFSGLGDITFIHAVGLALVLSLFKSTGQNMKDEYVDSETTVGIHLLKPWMALLIGYVVTLFI